MLPVSAARCSVVQLLGGNGGTGLGSGWARAAGGPHQGSRLVHRHSTAAPATARHRAPRVVLQAGVGPALQQQRGHAGIAAGVAPVAGQHERAPAKRVHAVQLCAVLCQHLCNGALALRQGRAHCTAGRAARQAAHVGTRARACGAGSAAGHQPRPLPGVARLRLLHCQLTLSAATMTGVQALSSATSGLAPAVGAAAQAGGPQGGAQPSRSRRRGAPGVPGAAGSSLASSHSQAVTPKQLSGSSSQAFAFGTHPG